MRTDLIITFKHSCVATKKPGKKAVTSCEVFYSVTDTLLEGTSVVLTTDLPQGHMPLNPVVFTRGMLLTSVNSIPFLLPNRARRTHPIVSAFVFKKTALPRVFRLGRLHGNFTLMCRFLYV